MKVEIIMEKKLKLKKLSMMYLNIYLMVVIKINYLANQKVIKIIQY